MTPRGGNGRCNALASSHGARIHTSRSSSVVRITGMALGWIGFTTALGAVVRKPQRADGGLRPGCYSNRRAALHGSGVGTIVAISASSLWVHNRGSNIPTSRTYQEE